MAAAHKTSPPVVHPSDLVVGIRSADFELNRRHDVRVRGGAVWEGAKSCILVHQRIVRQSRLMKKSDIGANNMSKSSVKRTAKRPACLLLAGFGGETLSPLLGSSGGYTMTLGEKRD
jgi:hypothetical protein